MIGPPATGKTFTANIIAKLYDLPFHQYNCHMQTDVTDFIGAVRPVTSVKHNHTLQSNVQLIPIDVDDMADNAPEPNNILEWVDGPLIQAMRQGAILLIDEINLASDNILERLNSVLEFEKTITL